MRLVDDALKANGKLLTGLDYEEINKITFQGQNQCNDLHYNLMAKLSVPTAEVRLKTLQVIKHLLSHGHPLFKDVLQKKHRPLQLCGTFRGPPDPVLGDSQYAEIRQLAQEIMNMLFEKSPTASSPSTFDVPDGSDDTPLAQALRATRGSTASENLPTTTGNALAALTGGGSGMGFRGLGAMGGLGSLPSPTHLPAATPVFVAPIGQPGYEGLGSQGMSHSYEHHLDGATPAPAPAPAPASAPIRHEQAGEYERRLIDELTEPTGVRAVPPRDALARFLQRCASLDRTTVAECLLDKLDGATDLTKAKALHVLEALVTAPAPIGPEVLKALEPYVSEVRDAEASCTQALAKQKAQKVLSLLGAATPRPATVVPNAQPPTGAASPASSNTAAASPLDSFFSGLVITPQAQPPVPAAAVAAPQAPALSQTAPQAPRSGSSTEALLASLPLNIFNTGSSSGAATTTASLSSIYPPPPPAPTGPLVGAAPYPYPYPYPPPAGAYPPMPAGAYPYPYPPPGAAPYARPVVGQPAEAAPAPAGGKQGASGGSFDFVGEEDKFSFVAEAMMSGKLS
ncbi:hypothetical protein PAPYR_2659 [Paratrimastix pyriformis]|uniref:ENTH domain-containing protein n=1 Tax=Paratrimastix pyriformis TaxID=342808 RepID=A0ABQ8UNU1_9EUKA|nr:hypothetical protein PAPYR_2659 [Paratrimastix pyriformis]